MMMGDFVPGAQVVERNSVLFIPAILSPAECSQLVADVERAHAERMPAPGRRCDSHASKPDTFGHTLTSFPACTLDHRATQTEAYQRYMISEHLSPATQQLFETVMRARQADAQRRQSAAPFSPRQRIPVVCLLTAIILF